jgi:hypothetical protein
MAIKNLGNVLCCGDVTEDENGYTCVEGNCPFMPGCGQLALHITSVNEEIASLFVDDNDSTEE